ncbi:two-component system sensor histidine kinase CbrA [Halomonas shantousis]
MNNASLYASLALGLGYLALLFGCALAVERRRVSERLIRHPAVHALALGVYASAWATYGSLELAAEAGYGYLAYYLGVAGAFLLAPVLLVPIYRLTQTYQLASLADLFAFRFRSRWVGTLITLVTLLAVMPLLALQIQTLDDALGQLTGRTRNTWLILLLCLFSVLFAIRFGIRQAAARRQDSLLAVIALESLVKLGAMLALGCVALYGVFSGPADLQSWLDGAGQAYQHGVTRLDAGQWRTLLLLFFAAAFLMPHMFHVVFTENPSREALFRASWSLPLYLLGMALPVPLIVWAAQRLGLQQDIAYAAFSLSDAWWTDALAFLAGLAAASGTLIIISLALSGMLLNHLVLVARPPDNRTDLYRWLHWLRCALVAVVIFCGWLFYRLVGIHHDLTTLGITAFVGMAQCLPGMLAVLYWPGANRKGMVTGLLAGTTIWAAGLWLPLLTGRSPLMAASVASANPPDWYAVALMSLAVNIVGFIAVSLMTRTSEGERAAAESCSVDAVIRSKRLPLAVHNGDDIRRQLAPALGADVASREVARALDELGLSPVDGRPYVLRRLRDRIQINLSGLMGPAVAQDIVDRFLPYQPGPRPATDDIHYVESRLEAYRSRLRGLSRELDSLRRYHRRTLAELPVGLCAFGDDDELLMWNEALAALSGIAGSSIIGSRLDNLPPPWSELLERILLADSDRLYKQGVVLGDRQRFLTLHKARLMADEGERGGAVILVEDHSEMKWLEDELRHAERLASIGQLAAGVAHEIGNPVTGISSLVQNLRYDTTDPAVLETADQIQQLTTRISRILQSLTAFAHGGQHPQAGHVEKVALHDITEQALHLIHLARSGQDVHYYNRCPEDLMIMGNAQHLVQVMINLLGNARDASPQGGEVTIEACRDREGIRLNVTDAGQGVAATVRDHLFEPFTTTKPPGQGTGLGLSLVYSIVREHHGQIHIESPPPGQACGTRVTVWFPFTQDNGERFHEPDIDR